MSPSHNELILPAQVKKTLARNIFFFVDPFLKLLKEIQLLLQPKPFSLQKQLDSFPFSLVRTLHNKTHIRHNRETQCIAVFPNKLVFISEGSINKRVHIIEK